MSLFIKQRVLMRESEGTPHVYTVRFPDPMSTIGVREDQARGLCVGISYDGNAIRNDFDRVPIFQRPIFNATWDPFFKRWEDLVPQGAETFSWSPTEKNREVVYRCRPFWYQLDMAGDYGPYRVSVADRPVKGFHLAPIFKNGTDFVYRPVFEMTVDGEGIPHSRAGESPLTEKATDLIEIVQRYDSAARLESVRDWFSDTLLQLVEFARWDIGTLMTGNRGGITYTGDVAPLASASLCDLGNGYGCFWRGKENPWKNANSCLWDVLGKKIKSDSGDQGVMLYYLTDPSKYTGTLNEYYQPLGEYAPHRLRGQEPVGGWSFSEPGILWPSTGRGDEATTKCFAYIMVSGTLSAEEYLINVAVGGSSLGSLLPVAQPSSPFHWEACQRNAGRDSSFGGRLVLEER